jgi:hypothetical protein
MFRAFVLGMLSAIVALAASLTPGALAQTDPNLRFVSVRGVQNSVNVKLPDVSDSIDNVLLAGSANRRDAFGWKKATTDQDFGAPFRLGNAEGDPEYSTSSVSALPNGSAYYAWIEQDEGSPIAARSVAADGSLGPRELVVAAGRGGALRVFVDVAATSDGTVVVVWNENSRYRYSYKSPATGGSWQGPIPVSDIRAEGKPAITTGAGNTIAIGFRSSDFDIYAGKWNGSGFNVELVAGGDDIDANPDITLLPDGRPVVAWRRLGSGYWYSENKPNDAQKWPASKLSSIELFGNAGIDADSAGNLSFAWTGVDGNVYAAYQASSGPLVGPVGVNQSGDYFNADVAMNLASESIIHVVAEKFNGPLTTEYIQFSARGAGLISATPAIEGGAEIVGNRNSVTVNFSNVNGAPNQVRWRWGAPPTDAENDSGGWQQLPSGAAPQISVGVPASVNSSDCVEERLFTQVRSTSATEATAKSDTIKLDNVVARSVQVSNPYLAARSTVFTGNGAALQQNTTGALNGDPAWTRDPIFYLSIVGLDDCAGIASFQYGSSTNALGPVVLIDQNFYANNQVLPNPSAGPGPQTIVVRVRDKAGNISDFSRVLTVDQSKPDLGPVDANTLVVEPNARATILVDLTFTNLTASDNYSSRGYWGVWIANSRTQVDPLTAQLNWSAVPAPPSGDDFTIRGHSLASGLTTPIGAGDYYIYVRVLDGAGNPSDEFIERKVTLSAAATLPRTYTPLVRR